MKKLSKIGIISLTLIIASALTVCGVLMSYYVNVTVNVDSGVILEYSATGVYGGEEVNAEDLDLTYDFLNFVGDDVDTKQAWYKCNANLDKDLPITFTITDTSIDDPDGLTIAWQYDNSGTWTDIFNWTATQSGSTSGDFTFNPAQTENFRMWVSGNHYLEEGDHSFLLEVEYDTTP